MKVLKAFPVLLLALALFTSSCQHDMDIIVPDHNNAGQILNPNPVQASVQGKVIDQNGQAVAGATVKSGTNTTTTDSRGLFRFSNISLDKYASVVTVEYNGYFKGIRTFSAINGSANFVKIQLIPKILAGTVNTGTGGTATLPNNSTVTLEANSVIVKSTGLPYSGSVQLYAAYIDPTSVDIAEKVPGSFQATDTANFRVLLQSFGMLAVQLESPAGEVLQIATGKTARLHFSIPSSLTSAAPTTIPLWSLNENNGLWKQEGSASKNGNAYEGSVAHFSFWNCDASANTINLELTVITANGPLPNAFVKITRTSTGASSYGYTDSTGHVSGLVFSNEALELYVLDNCFAPVYSQNIGPFTQNTDLGNITVSLPAEFSLVISGSAVGCSGTPVTDGNARIYWEGQLITTPIVNGNYSLTLTRCSASTDTVSVIVIDNSTQQQSATWTGTSATGIVNTGSITACGLTTQVFINYNINGVNYSFTSPTDSIQQYGQGAVNSIIMGSALNSYINIGMDNSNIALNSDQPLVFVTCDTIEHGGGTMIDSPTTVHITELGAVGEFIAGNFTVNLTGASPGNNHYAVTCQFRVRREL